MSSLEHVLIPASPETLAAYTDYAAAMYAMTDAESDELTIKYLDSRSTFIDAAERAELAIYASGRVTPDHKVVGVDDPHLADLGALTEFDDIAAILALAILARDLLRDEDFTLLTAWASEPAEASTPPAAPAAPAPRRQSRPAPAEKATGNGRSVAALICAGLVAPTLFVTAHLSYQSPGLALLLLPVVAGLIVTASLLARSNRRGLAVPRQQGRTS
jgi:hypothetical protein